MEAQEKLIIDYLLGELEDNKTKEIENKIEHDSSFRELYVEYRDIILGTDIVYSSRFDLPDNKVRKLAYSVTDNKLKIKKLRLVKYVAATILVLGAFASVLTINKSNNKEKEIYTEYSVPNGTKGEILLSDGTKVILNAGSNLRYSNWYGQKSRNVYLTGEGFFDVVKNKDLPFKVNTEELCITAIGTKFNVKSYLDEQNIEAVLVEGSVKVEKSKNSTINGFDRGIILSPNQGISFLKTGISSGKSQHKYVINHLELENADIYTSWKDQVWVIKSERLETLARKLERRYSVSISFVDSDLRDVKFTGKFENEPIEQVLKAIELTALVNVSIKGNKIELAKSPR